MNNTERQNMLASLSERVRSRELTAAQANVEMVRAERVCVVGKLPRDVRAAYNAAVKAGLLCHMKKDAANLKPEVYYHPEFEYLANAKRAEARRNTINALRRVAGFPAGDDEE